MKIVKYCCNEFASIIEFGNLTFVKRYKPGTATFVQESWHVNIKNNIKKDGNDSYVKEIEYCPFCGDNLELYK